MEVKKQFRFCRILLKQKILWYFYRFCQSLPSAVINCMNCTFKYLRVRENLRDVRNHVILFVNIGESIRFVINTFVVDQPRNADTSTLFLRLDIVKANNGHPAGSIIATGPNIDSNHTLIGQHCFIPVSCHFSTSCVVQR